MEHFFVLIKCQPYYHFCFTLRNYESLNIFIHQDTSNCEAEIINLTPCFKLVLNFTSASHTLRRVRGCIVMTECLLLWHGRHKILNPADL